MQPALADAADTAALARVTRIVEIANAVLREGDADRCEAACGLISIACVLVHGNPAARTSFALRLLDSARELDPDVIAPLPRWT